MAFLKAKSSPLHFSKPSPEKIHTQISEIGSYPTGQIEALAGLDAAGFEEDFAREAVKLKAQEAKLRQFTRETQRRLDSSRVQAQGFGRSTSQRAVWSAKKNTLTNANGQVIIKVKRTKITGAPNSITLVERKKGGIDRNYYGSDGRQFKQISNNGHGHKMEEKIGLHGEHAHDYYFDAHGKLIREDARELSPLERKENGDIL